MIPRPCETVIKTDWTAERDAELMALIADGLSFSAVGKAMRLTKGGCMGRFNRLRSAMGWQVQ